jgi:hypothetical protein
MPRFSKYVPELRDRAVRMVFDHVHEHPSQWATIRSFGEKLGCFDSSNGARAGWRHVRDSPVTMGRG